MREHNIVLRVTAQSPPGAEDLAEGVDGGPAELLQQVHAGLLNEVELRSPWRHHATPSSTNRSRSIAETSICPVTSFGTSRSRSLWRLSISSVSTATCEKSGSIAV